jgi:hypothetical protein
MSGRPDGFSAGQYEGEGDERREMNIVAAVTAIVIVASVLAMVAVTVFDAKPSAHHSTPRRVRRPRR